MLYRKHIFFILFILLTVIFSGCGGGESSSENETNITAQAKGMAQKGPFVKDSTVIAYRLVNGERSTDTVSTKTFDERGSFALYLPWVGATELEITGTYLDENSGEYRTNGHLTLIVYANNDVVYNTNINILTHIASARIKEMLQNGFTYEEAKAASNQELKEIFNMEFADGRGPESLNLLDGEEGTPNRADNAQLLKISAAILKSTNPEVLLDTLVEDAKDGDLNGAGVGALDEIVKESAHIDLAHVGSVLDAHVSYSNAPKSDAVLAGRLPLDVKVVFEQQADVPLGVTLYSNAVIITGFEGELPVTIQNGTAFITHTDGRSEEVSVLHSSVIESGTQIKLRQISASLYETKKSTIITIGGRSFAFSTITKSDPNLIDTTVNDFELGAVFGADPNELVASNPVIVSGLSDIVKVDLQVTNGSYSLNGGVKQSGTAKVRNGDRVVVYLQANAGYQRSERATLRIGEVQKDFVVYTRAPDVVPDDFTIASKYNVAVESVYETPYITMTGYEGGLDLDVVNGEAQLEGEQEWRTHMSQFPAGYKVRFRQIAASEYDTKKVTTITLGSKVVTFETVTEASRDFIDIVPNKISFPPAVDVRLMEGESKDIISSTAVITGIRGGEGAYIVGDARTAIKINDGEWTREGVSHVQAGDTLQLKRTISSSSIGETLYASALYRDEDGVLQEFAKLYIYVIAADTTADPVSFEDVEDAALFKEYISNEVTISGLDEGVSIEVHVMGDGFYSKNGAVWEHAGTFSVKNGDRIKLKILSSSQEGVLKSMSLVFDESVATFNVTTNSAPEILNRPSFENLTVGESVVFVPEIRDNGNTAVHFSLEGAPAWLTLDATTGRLSGRVASGVYHDVNLTVRDSGGLSRSILFDVVADIAPELQSNAFGKEFILDDSSSNPHQYSISFSISDADTNLNQVHTSLRSEITEVRVAAGSAIASGFNGSKIICDLHGSCSALIAIDFAENNGFHPSLKTRHYITVNDGVKQVTKYVDIWYAPIVPYLSGATEQSIGFVDATESAYRHYSFRPTNSGGKASSWAVINKPAWALFNSATGELSGTPALNQNGSYKNIQIFATNDRGPSNIFKFNITVVDKTPPKPFTIPDLYGVEINKPYDESIVVDWLDAGSEAPISISGYEFNPNNTGYRVNGVENVTTVKNGDVVSVWHISSNEYNTKAHTTLHIGDESDDFITVTKESADTKLPLIVGAPKTDANIYEFYSYTPQISSDYTKYAPVTKPFVIENKPPWADFDPATGRLSGTATQQALYKNVRIIAYGENGLDYITFTITVSNGAPSMSGDHLSLENRDMNLTFNDNPDWRSKITSLAFYSCYMQNEPTVLDAADYTLEAGKLTLHNAVSDKVALHTPSYGGVRLVIEADGYLESYSTLDFIENGQYGVKANLSAQDPLIEDSLDGAKVQIELLNRLEFADESLNAENFLLTTAPEDLHIAAARYIDATHAELTLSYNGIDFDRDSELGIHIENMELNSECVAIDTNNIPVQAVIERPYINILYPDDPTEGAKFAYSVADDNGTIAVAARTGVYIFTKGSDGNYTQTQKIDPLDIGEYFGDSLALEGDYLVIGDKHHTEDNKSFAGIALVYKRVHNGDYIEIADLRPADLEAYDNFGSSVDISGDMIIVGAENAQNHQGKAYLYKKDADDNFTLLSVMSRENAKAEDLFGHDVAITHGTAAEEDDYFIVVGSYVLPDYNATTGETDTKEELGAGFANYYTYRNGTLSDAVVITADDTSTLSDHFGSAVALDGNLVVIASHQKLYTYARGEGNALLPRQKIESAGVGISAKDLAVNFTGFDNHARYVIVSGTKSFISSADGSSYHEYHNYLGENDNLGYSVAVDGFEVVMGAYTNRDLVEDGGAALVTHAYENITGANSSALTPPAITAPFGATLSMESIVFNYEADNAWKNAVSELYYKSGSYGSYLLLDADDYTFGDDNTIALHIANSGNVALHTPYETGGSLLVKADGYFDDVVTIDQLNGGTYAIKATLNVDSELQEDHLDGAEIDVILENTLEFQNQVLNSANFSLSLVPDGVRIDSLSYIDATHALITLSFDGTDFDTDRNLSLHIDADALNAVEGVVSNTIPLRAVVEATVSTEVKAVDPYIVGARFWYDADGDGIEDVNELSSFSDSNGTASFDIALEDGALLTMVDAGIHNGQDFEGVLRAEYNASTSGVISPVTSLLVKGFDLDELVSLLVDAGLDSLTKEELLLDPYDPSLLPADGNFSTYSNEQIEKFARVLMANVALNGVSVAVDLYNENKDEIYAALQKVYSQEGEEGENQEDRAFTILQKLVSIGKLLLGTTNLREHNARVYSRIYLSMNDYLVKNIQANIAEYGDDSALYWLFVNELDMKVIDMIAPLFDSFERAVFLGVKDPKFEYVKVNNTYQLLWMVTKEDLANVSNRDILIRYEDENANQFNLIFSYNHDYYEDFSRVGSWQIVGTKIGIDNGKEIELHGTYIVVDGVSYKIIESSVSVGSNFDTMRLSPPAFIAASIKNGARYVDIDANFVFTLEREPTVAMQERTYCSLREGYTSLSDINVTLKGRDLVVTPLHLLRRNSNYHLSCGIAYGDESSYSGDISFTSEEMNIPIMKTLQTKSYDENGAVVSDGSIKDDGYYQKGWSIDRSSDNNAEQIDVLDNRVNLLYTDEANNTQTYTHLGAFYACSNLVLNGYDDWRLPTANELMALARYDGNETIPNFLHLATTKTSVSDSNYGYWTSERNIDSSSYNSDEYLYGTLPENLLNVNEAEEKRRICVRQFESRNEVKSDLQKDDDIVFDEKNNLEWMDDEQTNEDRTWIEAIAYCESLEAGDHDDWRLPNINEIQRTVGHVKDLSDRGEHSLNPIFNATNISAEFWSSTSNADATEKAYVLEGVYGTIHTVVKTAERKARCVRGGY